MKTRFAFALAAILICHLAHAQEFGPWSQPVNLGSVINTAFDDFHPMLSKDGLSLIFSSTRPGGAGGIDLWVSERDSVDDPWQTPYNITALNSHFDDHAAYLTTDGHWLFFYSTRPGGCNGSSGRTELWAAHRKDRRDNFGWDPPVELGCTINILGSDEGAPAFWEDSATGTLYLYFARNLTPANANGFDIYVTTCSSDISGCIGDNLWTTPTIVSELNSPARDTRMAIRRRDGLELILSSSRLSAAGLDLWVSTRASVDEAWSVPVNLNADNSDKCALAGIDPCPTINTASTDSAPAISWDGRTMIFYSNRAGGFGGQDLYMSTREKLTSP